MMTYITSESFWECARNLDDKRLSKQRYDCLRIMQIIADPEHKSANHPVVLLWKDDPSGLLNYSRSICDEYRTRQYHLNQPEIETVFDQILKVWENVKQPYGSEPCWRNCSALIDSHRAALLHKNPGWYSRWMWKVTPRVKYFWP